MVNSVRHSQRQHKLIYSLVLLYVGWLCLVTLGSVLMAWQQFQFHAVMTVTADELVLVVHHHEHSRNYQHLVNHPESHAAQSGDHDHAIQLDFKPAPYQPLLALCVVPLLLFLCWLLPLAPCRLLPMRGAPPFLSRLSPHGLQASVRLLI